MLDREVVALQGEVLDLGCDIPVSASVSDSRQEFDGSRRLVGHPLGVPGDGERRTGIRAHMLLDVHRIVKGRAVIVSMVSGEIAVPVRVVPVVVSQHVDSVGPPGRIHRDGRVVRKGRTRLDGGYLPGGVGLAGIVVNSQNESIPAPLAPIPPIRSRGAFENVRACFQVAQGNLNQMVELLNVFVAG